MLRIQIHGSQKNVALKLQQLIVQVLGSGFLHGILDRLQ